VLGEFEGVNLGERDACFHHVSRYGVPVEVIEARLDDTVVQVNDGPALFSVSAHWFGS
jgi:hypothetical protein